MAIIPSQIDNDRNSFFKNCEYITRAPASLFLEGNRHSQKAKIMPIPLYVYVGIENGHSEFSYEEFNCDLEASKEKVKEIADVLELPRNKETVERERKLTAAFLLSKVSEEERRSMATTPHSSFINYRRTCYPEFLNRHYKENLRYAMVTPKVIREANIKKRSDLTMDARIKILQLRDKYLAENSNELFKLKVWSEIPFTGGLNEGAAIAAATALALQLRLSPEEIQERMAELGNLRENLWEEVAIDGWFMTIFTRALALDFFSNGAAVFASLLGCNREQEVINYECLILGALKDHFIPYPEFKKKEERSEHDKNQGIIPYFDKCIKFKYNCLKAEPLYNWNYEKLAFKDKLAVAIISEPNIIHQRENFEMPPDLNIKCWRVSPYLHALIDEPGTVALCVANPEKHIFRYERKSLSRDNLGHSMFEVIYTSRRQGWGAKGADVEISEKAGVKEAEEKIELGLDDLGKPYAKINGKSITINERFFVDLTYFAVCKLKKPDGWVDLKKELKWTERHIKDYPSDLKDVLEKGSYSKAIHKDVFFDRPSGQGKIRLGIFKADTQSIIINENLCNFESEHRWTVQKTIDGIFWEIDAWKQGGTKVDLQKTKEIMDKLKFDREKIEMQELRPMLRHVFVISQAVKKMGWEFHDTQWLKKWRELRKKCNNYYELLEYNKKEKEEIGLYLGP